MARLGEIVSFRRDLLFNGAVQIDWLESNPKLARKAAVHFAFHGPSYHGVDREGRGSELPPVDTATFTLDIIERLIGGRADDPFALAIAGYGTGKSHLAVTLALALGAPDSEVADRVLANLATADRDIGARARSLLKELGQPFLVVALNGMKDFDLTGEIVRRILAALRERELDTSPLEDLRPRFRFAANFTASFFDALRKDYEGAFGPTSADRIVARLEEQDEEAFRRVSAIHEQRIGTPIRALGQESLHDFLRVARQAYCGPEKPFAGILILLDEFGRYLEFSVERPQVAGPGALQQLFEAVQANGEGVFFLGFIQYELQAYISRVARELRDDLQRYVTRYDAVHKRRLSTNLETLIANLLEKRDPAALARQMADAPDAAELQAQMKRWYPELADHAVWANSESFRRVVQEGCWPLHPLSTWLLYRLASVGRTLQQRSALSLLADAYEAFVDREVGPGFSIAPVDLCTEGLIEEFCASERFGQQGTSGQAYRSVLAKLGHQLSPEEIRVLKAVLLAAKTNARVASKQDGQRLIALLAGYSVSAAAAALQSLEAERGAVTWNEGLRQYEIVSDAVPRAQFVAYLADRVSDIPAEQRALIFSENFARWFPEATTFYTDFGAESQIHTKEWHYAVTFSNAGRLPNHIKLAFESWMEARAVNEPKGRLIYCYVDEKSSLSMIMEAARQQLRACLEQADPRPSNGAPIAIVFLNDLDGTFGSTIAEYWVLTQGLSSTEAQRYGSFVLDRQAALEQVLRNQFEALQRQRLMLFATDRKVRASTLSGTLMQLFEAVYPERIPFPFDGFSTTSGNAASDCGLFTRQLFQGHVDEEWIAALPIRQRNRAVTVLVDSWGVLSNAGGLRALPANAAVRRVIESLEARLTAPDDPRPLNLGRAFRELCAPPYGCNTASAGLLLGLFVGARKDQVELIRGGKPISLERWLQSAMPRNYLDLVVLDGTAVIRVSEQAMGEWNRLLNAWELETTHEGRARYLSQAEELRDRVPVPQALYYQYENLCLKATESRRKLQEYEEELEKGLKKVNKGLNADDVGSLSWGGAILSQLHSKLIAEREKWTDDQVRVVERSAAQARIETQTRFRAWLRRQTVTSASEFAPFEILMALIARNLERLGLLKEKAALEAHLEKLEEHIRFVEDVRQLSEQIDAFARANPLGGSMPLSALEALLREVAAFEQAIEEARQRGVEAVRERLDDAAKVLSGFRRACQDHIARLRERASALYNARIGSLSDIRKLQAEVVALCHLYEGKERDLSDFRMVGRQLDRLEADYRRLDSDELSESDFEALLKECIAATEAEFGEDEPPLDHEAAYEGIAEDIRVRRRQRAHEWMRTYVPDKATVHKADADRALEIRARLQGAPGCLAPDQLKVVSELLKACERRLDELEVEGLVARYRSLPEPSKQEFLKRIGVLAEA